MAGMPISLSSAPSAIQVTALVDEIPGQTRHACELTELNPDVGYQVFVSAINAVGGAEAIALADAEALETEEAGVFTPLPVIPVPVNHWVFMLALMALLLGSGLWRQWPWPSRLSRF